MLSRKKTLTKVSLQPLPIFGKHTKANTEFNMTKKLNESVLTTPPVINPHSPAANGYKQQPVEIPGVLHQTRQLFQPVIAIPPEDKK
jgi:hypothetical protein